MKKLMSAFLTTALAATSIAPALAGPHEHGGQAAARGASAPSVTQPQPQPRGDRGGGRAARQTIPQASAPQQAAPRQDMRHFDRTPRAAAPPRVAPQRFENRPARVENRPAPQRFENRPARFENRSAPQRFENRAAPQRFENRSAPQRFENRSARFENRGVNFENRPVRQHFENGTVTVPFVQRVRGDRDDTVPFAEVVRPKPARIHARNEAFVAGRVINEDNDELALENLAGETVVVRGWHGRHKHWGRANQTVTVPVVFENGAYYAVGSTFAPATFTSFVVPSTDLAFPAATYVPTYAYVNNAYVPAYSYTPDYTNFAVANTLSSLLSNVLGSNNSGSLANSLLTNYLASYALSSLSGYSPSYAGSFAAPATFAPITSVASFASPADFASPLSYTYPTTCVYNDPNTGASYYDPSCAPAATTTYYTSASAYAPAQVQGVVVGTSGSTLMVLGSNGLNPVLVNDAPALQSGLAFSGQPAVGRVINAYGFYDGNTFVATALQ